jgi:hypothetical protein
VEGIWFYEVERFQRYDEWSQRMAESTGDLDVDVVLGMSVEVLLKSVTIAQ